MAHLASKDGRRTDPTDLIFPDRNGDPLRGSSIRRTLDKVVEGTDLDGWPVAQTARRTVGTAIDRVHGSEAAAAHLGNSRVVAISHYLASDRERPDFSGALESFDPTKIVETELQNVDPEWD